MALFIISIWILLRTFRESVEKKLCLTIQMKTYCNESFLAILLKRVWLISAALLVLEGEQILLANDL